MYKWSRQSTLTEQSSQFAWITNEVILSQFRWIFIFILSVKYSAWKGKHELKAFFFFYPTQSFLSFFNRDSGLSDIYLNNVQQK